MCGETKSSITVLVAIPIEIVGGASGRSVRTPRRDIAICEMCPDVASLPVGRLVVLYISTERESFQEVSSLPEKVIAYIANPTRQDIYGALSNPGLSYSQNMKSS